MESALGQLDYLDSSFWKRDTCINTGHKNETWTIFIVHKYYSFHW